MQLLEHTRAQPDVRLSARSSQCGVRRLLLRAMLIIVPVVLFLTAFEIRFRQLNPSHFATKKMLLERRAKQVETLILGSSHELTGIDPVRFGGAAFNLASQSQSLYYDAALIRKFRPTLPALKRVILPVSYFTLEYQLEDAPERWRAFHYRYFYGLPHRDWHNVVSARNFSAYFLSSETTRVRVLMGNATNALAEYDEWGGWTNRPAAHRVATLPDTNALRQAALGTIRIHHGMMRREHFEENVRLLNELVLELQQHGIKVVLVTLPVTRYYSAEMRPESYHRMQAALHQLSADHGVAYLNLLNDPRFELSDFADGDHLNHHGAVKLSEFLRDALGW